MYTVHFFKSQEREFWLNMQCSSGSRQVGRHTPVRLLWSVEQFVREAFLWLHTVVLASRHGECDADTRLDVQELSQGAKTVGVDQQGVFLDLDVRVKYGERLVDAALCQLCGQQVLLQLVARLFQLEHFFLQPDPQHTQCRNKGLQNQLTEKNCLRSKQFQTWTDQLRQGGRDLGNNLGLSTGFGSATLINRWALARPVRPQTDHDM